MTSSPRRAGRGARGLVLSIVLVFGCFGCSKKSEPEPTAPPDDRPPPMPAAELQRGTDACKAYVERVCACTTAAAQQACPLARALPDAVRIGMEVSMSPDSDRLAVLHAHDSMRKTIKECIEQVAKLPSLGC